MKKIIWLFWLIVASVVISYGGDRSYYGKKVTLKPGEELNVGLGVTSLLAGGGTHLHMNFRPMGEVVGANISFGTEIRHLVQFQTYSLAFEGIVKLTDAGDWYLISGYRWAAVYTNAHSNNMPITYFGGVTAGVGGDIWRSGWTPYDRVAVTAQWWFSKTASMWHIQPPAPKIIITLTYFVI